MIARYVLRTLLALLLASCIGRGSDPPAPLITAQGFDMAIPRVSQAGNVGDVRIRFEVPGKIESIRIAQGTFRTDLATTLDQDDFRLFGLERRPYSMSDVTVNLRNYANERLIGAGVYPINIGVTDRLGQTAEAQVLITIQGMTSSMSSPSADTIDKHVGTGEFVLQRVGPGRVSGAELFGFTWKTVDPINVTIRLEAKSDGATRIARLDGIDFDGVLNHAELVETVDRCIGDQTIEFDTANAAAAGQVFAVTNNDDRFLLQASASQTYLTDAGTTVVVTGRYKY